MMQCSTVFSVANMILCSSRILRAAIVSLSPNEIAFCWHIVQLVL